MEMRIFKFTFPLKKRFDLDNSNSSSLLMLPSFLLLALTLCTQSILNVNLCWVIRDCSTFFDMLSN